MNLHGRSAVITGASQGLGRAIAEHYVRAGASVLLTARAAGPLDDVRAALAALAGPGQHVLALPADVGSPEDCRLAVARAVDSLPGLCVLINNAGIQGPLGVFEEANWEQSLETFCVNLFGTAMMCRELLPHFRARNYGKIVNLSGG